MFGRAYGSVDVERVYTPSRFDGILAGLEDLFLRSLDPRVHISDVDIVQQTYSKAPSRTPIRATTRVSSRSLEDYGVQNVVEEPHCCSRREGI